MSKLTRLLARMNPFRGTVTESSIITDYPPFGNPMGGINYPLLANLITDRLERQRGGNSYERFSQDRMLFVARHLDTHNPVAQGMMEALVNYTLGVSGMTPTCTAKPGKDEGLAREVLAFINHFRDVEDWAGCLEAETLKRPHRDGNALLRFFVEDGDVRCDYIEPEALAPKDGSEEWLFGVKTERHRPSRVEAYGVQWGPGDWEEIDAREIYHIKCGVDRCIKLGISDFTSTGELIAEAYKAYRNFAAAEAVRQSYTYIRKHAEGVTTDEIDSFHDQVANVRGQSASIDSLLKDFKLQFQNGVGVEEISSGMDLAAIPTAENMPGVVAGINATLLMAAVRYHMPLWLVAGDMSQNNVVDLGDESGFSTYIRRQQNWYGRHQRNIYWKAIETAVLYDLLPEAVLDSVEIEVNPQQAPPRDPKAATDRLKILDEDNIISKRKRTELEGFDFEEMQEEIAKEPKPAPPPAPPEEPAPVAPPPPPPAPAPEQPAAPQPVVEHVQQPVVEHALETVLRVRRNVTD